MLYSSSRAQGGRYRVGHSSSSSNRNNIMRLPKMATVCAATLQACRRVGALVAVAFALGLLLQNQQKQVAVAKVTDKSQPTGTGGTGGIGLGRQNQHRKRNFGQMGIRFKRYSSDRTWLDPVPDFSGLSETHD